MVGKEDDPFPLGVGNFSGAMLPSALENGWLEYDRFLLGRLGLFSGLVSGRVKFRECIPTWMSQEVSKRLVSGL